MSRLIALTTLLTCCLLTACGHSLTRPDQHAGMDCIAPDVYVDAKMPAAQRKQFLQELGRARAQVSHFFGSLESSPAIYACYSTPCLRRFGGIHAKAKSIDDNKVILSSRGLGQVTLAHELTHIEFHKRLGSSQIWNKVPMWFDEGLAVLACKDPNVGKPSETLALDQLHSQQQWLAAIRDNKPAYSVAKWAVQNWYRQAGHEGLQTLIERLKQGESFTSAAGLARAQRLSRL